MSLPIVKHIVLGMAGHIDHGKTSIVKALTGVDTDRLKEEKERGMTTDLGFAFLGDDITIIDVPGHEKFVKTMVAGVNTVDVALLVIAADDGVMPQTREHLEILRLLQIPVGLIALNKIDLAERDWLEMVRTDIKTLVSGTFLEGAPVVPLSTSTGEGVQDLRDAIEARVQLVRGKKDKGVFRMPIDRVFTIKGFGTVVAGTVLSGKIRVDDTMELLPHGKQVCVRGLQVHDKPVGESSVGLRTAVNLQGVEKETIERGDVLGQPDYYKPTSMVDARLSYLSMEKGKLENRARVHFHVGTTEVVARVILLQSDVMSPGEEAFVQIHFEKPVMADVGDRFVIRSYSPVRTIGGGSVLAVHPEKHKRFHSDVSERLSRIGQGDPEQMVLEEIAKAETSLMSVTALAIGAGMPQDVCVMHLRTLESANKVVQLGPDAWCAADNLEVLKKRSIDLLGKLHAESPLKAGIQGSEVHSRLRPTVERDLFDAVATILENEGTLRIRGDRFALSSHTVTLTPDQQRMRQSIEKVLLKSPLMPPNLHEVTAGLGKEGERLVTLLIETGELVRLEQDIVIHKQAIAEARQRIEAFLSEKGHAGLGEIREHLGITRKYALPLLLHLDAIGFTERVEDRRRLKSKD